MNNKLLKENAMLTLYITSFIEHLNNLRREVKKNRNIDSLTRRTIFHFYTDLIRYFEQCLEEVNKC